jgi:hypothetical protein
MANYWLWLGTARRRVDGRLSTRVDPLPTFANVLNWAAQKRLELNHTPLRRLGPNQLGAIWRAEWQRRPQAASE